MKSSTRITVRLQEAKWRTAGVDVRELRRAARLALVRAKCSERRGQLTILLADDECLRQLNEKFCDTPFPTDVLSFPAPNDANDCLGDVAIAHGVAARDAAAAGTPLAYHVTHLAVHGVLHLLGYDHGTADEARVMEPLETAILGEMGIPDPYARVPHFA